MLTAAVVQYLHSMLPCFKRGSRTAEVPFLVTCLGSKYTGFAVRLDGSVPAIGFHGSPPIYTLWRHFGCLGEGWRTGLLPLRRMRETASSLRASQSDWLVSTLRICAGVAEVPAPNSVNM